MLLLLLSQLLLQGPCIRLGGRLLLAVSTELPWLPIVCCLRGCSVLAQLLEPLVGAFLGEYLFKLYKSLVSQPLRAQTASTNHAS